MTTSLDTIRYHSGIAGEEVADMVDSLEQEVSTLREQVEKLTEECVVLRASSRSKLETILVKAEENEAIIAAANALENIASTSSSTRIRRVANDALTAIRARRKA